MSEHRQRMIPVINSFTDEWGFLSNFYPAVVYLDGVAYASVEHAYQAAKTLDLKRREILSLDFNPRLTAAKAKAIGRKIKPLRENWDEIKNGIMRELLIQKFSHPALRDKLLSTLDMELVEGNWWHDVHFGVCFSEFRGRLCDYGPHEPIGDNWLGRLLMEVRVLVTLPPSGTSASASTPETQPFGQPAQ